MLKEIRQVPLSSAIHAALEALDEFNNQRSVPDADDRRCLSELVDILETAIRDQLRLVSVH